jgi:DeoR/GlpR family transcriptional regulator of sugar metabolism
MLARQRQERILAEVRRNGGAKVSDLVDLLQVSDMTVRRDIDVLARRDLVLRVHGGATAIGGHSTEEPGFAAKSLLAQAEKVAIAHATAKLIGSGDSVALSAGTTTYQVARELSLVENLTVVTNSPPVADLLHELPAAGRTVVLTGGVRTPSNALVGPVSVRTLGGLHVDTLILGVHGIEERAGVTTPNLMEAETNRALVSSARRCVVVADHSKWNVVGLAGIAGLDRIDVLVTDSGLPTAARRTLSSLVGQLLIVDPQEGAP